MNPYSEKNHRASCLCCSDPSTLSRRRFLYSAAGGFAAASLLSAKAWAHSEAGSKTKYDAMILSCIDPRIRQHVCKFAEGQGFEHGYSEFVFAGAAVGAVAPRFEGWHETFWENLGISLKLHKIPKVIAINHRSCGAASEAYGSIRDDVEIKFHTVVMKEFRKQLRERHPQLHFKALLMNLDGGTEELLKGV